MLFEHEHTIGKRQYTNYKIIIGRTAISKISCQISAHYNYPNQQFCKNK